MRKRGITALGGGLAFALGGICFSASAVEAQESPTTVASGLNGPMGVLVTSDGSVWVIETGVGGETEIRMPAPASGEMTTAKYGETARVIRIAPDGAETEVASLPSLVIGPFDSFGGARLAMLEGTLYATSGGWGAYMESDPPPLMAAVVRIEEGRVEEVANIWEIEHGQNPDGLHLESNPFGLAAGPDGNLWMTDAAGNSLLKVDPVTGRAEVVTVFEAVPSPIPNPARGGAMETDPVPTGLAFDRDGDLYVALLAGFPFAPGSSKVVRVTTDGRVSDYATGLTMLTDLRPGPDGHLYAVSFGRFTQQGPVPNSGAIIRVKEGTGSVEVVSGLSFPTSVDFNAAGDAYVTLNGMAETGTGEVVMYEGLAGRSGPGR